MYGLSDATIGVLSAAGLSLAQVARMTDKEILEIKHIGETRLRELRGAIATMVENPPEDEDPKAPAPLRPGDSVIYTTKRGESMVAQASHENQDGTMTLTAAIKGKPGRRLLIKHAAHSYHNRPGTFQVLSSPSPMPESS